MAQSTLERRHNSIGNTFIFGREPCKQQCHQEYRTVLPLRRHASYAGFMPVEFSGVETHERIMKSLAMEAKQRKSGNGLTLEGNWLADALSSPGPPAPEDETMTHPEVVLMQKPAAPPVILLQRRLRSGVGVRWPPTTTTIMARNLPPLVAQRAFIEALHSARFEGCYDFCYVPCSFETGNSKGYGFVNMKTPELAAQLRDLWQAQRPFPGFVDDRSLSMTPAVIQGLEDNVAKWNAPRVKRIRNPNLRPFVAGAES